jgi:hypothetical protein
MTHDKVVVVVVGYKPVEHADGGGLVDDEVLHALEGEKVGGGDGLGQPHHTPVRLLLVLLARLHRRALIPDIMQRMFVTYHTCHTRVA